MTARHFAGVVLGCLAAAAAALDLAAEEPFWQVRSDPAAYADGRAAAVRDLDHPAGFTPAFATRTDWEARAAELRRQVRVALGLWPMPERTPLAPVVRGRIARDGYTVEKVAFASAPGHYVTGNLYRPTGRTGRLPAVLSPHGHWENGRLLERKPDEAKKETASGAEQTMEGATYPLQARAATLARLGAVVFLYDMVGYADSRAIPHREGFTDAEAELRLQSFMGLQMWNAVRALDFLAGLPDVDPSRIGVTGASGGGTQTFLLYAIDDRPAAAVPAVMVSGNMQGGCICENASLLRLGTNNIELAALFAPKPLGLIAANDWTHDIETKGLPELQKIYGLFGATPAVAAKHFAFPHNYNQVSREYMYAWLNRHLRLGHPEPVREPAFTPVPPAELAVFDAEHPRPGDELGAADLRRGLTAASERQLRALARRPGELRRVLQAGFETALADRFRGSFSVVEGSFRKAEGPGFSVHKSVLTRPGSAARIPTIGIVPAGWAQRAVAVWTHPRGKAAAFEADGRTLAPAVRALVDGGAAVLVPDVFLTGEAGDAAGRPRVKNEEKYAGYNYGYNRTVFAERVSDLLTVLGFAQTLGAREILLVGSGRAGVWALGARALAGDVVSRAGIDLDRFDFDQVTRTDDEMLLPGALKYGGVMGLAALCRDGRTTIFGAPERPVGAWLPRPDGVTSSTAPASAEVLAHAVLTR